MMENVIKISLDLNAHIKNINEIKFIPFINNCNPNTKGLNNAKYGLFQISYLNYNEDADSYNSEDLKIIDLVNDPHNRCIQSFYKTLF